MKKIILSALLAGVTTGLAFASSAQALDPSKYSAGIALGWGAQDKTTYETNLASDTTLLEKGVNTFTTNGYITQKTFPTVDFRLGYNVNYFLQLGLNALYTHKLESAPDPINIWNKIPAPTKIVSLYMKTQENLFDVMVRAHFYSPESSMGTALFTGPSAGWESSKLKLGFALNAQAKEELQEAKKRKNTAILGWDLGIAQTVSKSETSIELMGTILADMKKEYVSAEFDTGASGLIDKGTLTQKLRPAGRLSIAVKQCF